MKAICLILFSLLTSQAVHADSSEDALKKECGRDFNAVTLGMEFDRVHHCASMFKPILFSTTQRMDGTTKVYRWMATYIEVKDGKVTALTRFAKN